MTNESETVKPEDSMVADAQTEPEVRADDTEALTPPSQPKLIAVLDARDRLVGTRRAFPGEGDIVLPDGCDLPLDGTYKWVEREKAFFPLGHGFQRPATKPNISEARVLYLICSQMRDSLPAEAAEWMQWYEENVKARDEEATLMRRIRRGR